MTEIDDFIDIKNSYTGHGLKLDWVSVNGTWIALGYKAQEALAKVNRGKYVQISYSPRYEAIRIVPTEDRLNSTYKTRMERELMVINHPIELKRLKPPKGIYYPMPGHPNVYKYRNKMPEVKES